MQFLPPIKGLTCTWINGYRLNLTGTGVLNGVSFDGSYADPDTFRVYRSDGRLVVTPDMTLMGYKAGEAVQVTLAGNLTALGSASGALCTGLDNCFLGANAGCSSALLSGVTTGTRNCAIGKDCLQNNGSCNAVMGKGAAIGYSGSYSVVVGYNSGSSASFSGDSNVIVGRECAINNVTTATKNTLVGNNACASLGIAECCVFVGNAANGRASVTASCCNGTTGFGHDACNAHAPTGPALTNTGNTGIGYSAARTLVTGTGVTCVGGGADVNNAATYNTCCIGKDSKAYGLCFDNIGIGANATAWTTNCIAIGKSTAIANAYTGAAVGRNTATARYIGATGGNIPVLSIGTIATYPISVSESSYGSIICQEESTFAVNANVTATQAVKGILRSTAGGITLTLPTMSNFNGILANYITGHSLRLLVCNSSAGALTVAAGVGGTVFNGSVAAGRCKRGWIVFGGTAGLAPTSYKAYFT
jgi:hypothetical protein